MIALRIPDIKDFMSMMLLKDTFDTFLLKEASITTLVTYTLDGTIHRDFADTDEAEEMQEPYVCWGRMREHCFSIIRGKKVPLHFSFVFRMSDKHTKRFLEQYCPYILPEQVGGLYLNCQFDGTRLLCTTGTSLGVFMADRRLEHAWDDMIRKFFAREKIFTIQC